MPHTDKNDGAVISLFQRKAEALGVKDANRHVDFCPICDAVVEPCDIDSEKTIRFMCVAAGHAPVSWKQENLGDKVFTKRVKSSDR